MPLDNTRLAEFIAARGGEGFGFEVNKRLTPGDVHVDRPLTNISIAYMQNIANFAADRIFPRIPVQKQSDLYFTYDRRFWNRSQMRHRPPSTETPGGSMQIATDQYFCDVFGIHMDTDDRVVANADSPLAPRTEATEWTMFQGLLFREIQWIASYFGAGIWSTNKTGVAATPSTNEFLQWNDAASTPIEDVSAWRDEFFLASGGFDANVMVMDRRVWTALKNHPDIVDRIKYGQTPGSPAIVTRAAVAALFEIDRIEVLQALVDSSEENLAESLGFIAPKGVALYYVNPSPGLRKPSAGYTFVWNGYIGAAEGQRVSSFRMDNIRSDRVELEMTFDHKVIGADMGLFAASAVA